MRLFLGVLPFLRNRYYVYSAKFAAVFGIGLGFESYLLPFLQRAESLRLNRREMHENVLSALIVGNKTVAFSVVEPFYSSVHLYTSCGADRTRLTSDCPLPTPFLL